MSKENEEKNKTRIIHVKESNEMIDNIQAQPNMAQKRIRGSTRVSCVSDTCDYVVATGIKRETKKVRFYSHQPQRSGSVQSDQAISPQCSQSSLSSCSDSHFLDAKLEAEACTRHGSRRNALNNVVKMALPEVERSRVEQDVELRRKSLKRKVHNFLTAQFNLDAEEDLF